MHGRRGLAREDLSGARLPVLATQPGTATAALDTIPVEVKRDRSARLRRWSDEACRVRWEAKVGREDVVLVDRPGRGFGDDYTPWLVDRPVGELVRVHEPAVTEAGVIAA